MFYDFITTYTEIFCCKNERSFCNAKASRIFSIKNIGIFEKLTTENLTKCYLMMSLVLNNWAQVFKWLNGTQCRPDKAVPYLSLYTAFNALESVLVLWISVISVQVAVTISGIYRQTYLKYHICLGLDKYHV